MRVLVTGSRDWDNPDLIERALIAVATDANVPLREVTVVHGGARGADVMVWSIARRLGMQVEVHRAHWRPEGRLDIGAGFKRNQHMVDLGADQCLAFIRNRSGGATHCANSAEKAGIHTIRYERGTE